MEAPMEPAQDQPETTSRIEMAMVDDILANQIASELKAAGQRRSNPMRQLGTLIVSLLLFFSLGLFKGSAQGVLILIGVIFIHELGHLLAMKVLKYRDVQIFFIPFFGAAAAGKPVAPSGTKKAIVSLMGPVPGIVVGIVLAVVYVGQKEPNPLLVELTGTFLFINVFNLLPFHPLDGGRFFEAILFSRHPILELVFKVLTTLIMGGIALFLKSPVLGIFSLFVFMTLKNTYSVARIAREHRKGRVQTVSDASDDIPVDELRILIPQVKKMLPEPHQRNPKIIATQISSVWQRIQNRPGRSAAAAGMAVVYLLCLLAGICSFFVFTWISYAIESRKQELMIQIHPDGSEHRYELTTIGSSSYQQIEIDMDGMFHGTQTNWHLFTQKIEKTGQWKNGYRQGEFLFYDLDGNNTEIIVYSNGVPTSFQTSVDGTFAELPKEQWPPNRKELEPQTDPLKTELFP